MTNEPFIISFSFSFSFLYPYPDLSSMAITFSSLFAKIATISLILYLSLSFIPQYLIRPFILFFPHLLLFLPFVLNMFVFLSS
ncbi:hypothetical protein Lalb_Chr20g0112531 [Lupinus albus]|uniref:Uncharacterized protein n=1 Tax=Lupinus albus TaxID=3870 RepID=A0A6A4NJF8_LUPAL|nr:hypothetical protein Lalb_Chr20g0112531 [Lupinus albus]